MAIGRFFKIHPDSMIQDSEPLMQMRGAGRRLQPLLMLGWSFWIFATPLMFDDRNDFSHWMWPTLASFAVFLWLYYRSYCGPRRQVLWCALAIAALGYLLTPFNPGGQSYVIYSCAFLAFTGSMRQCIRLMAAVLLVYCAEWMLLQFPWMYLVNGILISVVVGAMNLYRRLDMQKQAELKLSHDEVRRLAATAERERIGRDLHDLLGHTLSLIALKSELAGKLLARDPVAARREIADVERITRDGLAQVRSAVSGMRAAGLVGELASSRLMLECAGVRFTYSGFDRELPPAQESCLALALREAATNIQRHAGATRAEAQLVVDDEGVQLVVLDDGNGRIDVHGNGLSGMRERAEALGGSLRLDAQRGKGTRLTLRLPSAVATNVVNLASAQASARQASA